MKIPRYTKNDFIEAVKRSCNISDILDKLHLRAAGGNFATVRRLIQELQLDTSHLGKTRLRQQAKARSLDQVLKANTVVSSTSLRKRLVKEGLLKLECSQCNLTEWRGKQISLELDHIDGDKYNNTLGNLRLLCPNCHSQTPTYRGKNIGRYRLPVPNGSVPEQAAGTPFKAELLTHITGSNPVAPTKQCIDCDKEISLKATRCIRCRGIHNNTYKIIWPKTEDIRALLEKHSYRELGRILGVSDNAIRKRLRKYP